MSHANTPPPRCIGIIMDGNRRWARERGLPTLEGHRKGAQTLKDIVRAARSRGIEHLVAYAFSTENWKRADEEVSYLMRLIQEFVTNELEVFSKEGVRIRVAGERERFTPDIQAALERIEKSSALNDQFTLWLCLSYGGRAEILHAAREFASSGEPVTEESFEKHLWTAGMPDPDIIIRTSGENRLSGFLPWQGVYAELFFVPEYWPAFTEESLDRVLAEYAERERRHGK